MLKLKFSYMETSTLLSKYKGAFAAALAGDCIGCHYGRCLTAGGDPIKQLFGMERKLENRPKNGMFKSTFSSFVDTEMAHVLAQSLITDKGFIPTNVALRFSNKYFESPFSRIYSGSVATVLTKLQQRNYTLDPYLAAKEQFEGQGSYGNGSAMRVFPVGLYYFQCPEDLEKVASLSAQITHYHVDAVNGAILQAAAVEAALSCSSAQPTTWEKFWKILKDLAIRLEFDLEKRPYTERFDYMHDILNRKIVPPVEEIEENIGHGVKATEAVSAAIFSFLCCLADLQPPELSSFTKVQQTILFAISLGGDTNTIGTMAGAIAGACYGCDMIPDYWMFACEGSDVALKMAKKLFKIVSKRLHKASQTTKHDTQSR